MRTMRLVNLTPHTIAIETPEGRLYLSSEGVARVSMKTTPDCPVFICDPLWVTNGEPQGVESFTVAFNSFTVAFNLPIEYGEISGLPEPSAGVIYITSLVVAQRASRSDVVSPDSGPTAIRENGQIVAVRALNRHV